MDEPQRDERTQARKGRASQHADVKAPGDDPWIGSLGRLRTGEGERGGVLALAPTIFKAFLVHDRIAAVGLTPPAEGETGAGRRTGAPVLEMIVADLETLDDAGLSRRGLLTLMAAEPTLTDVDAALDDALEALEHNPLPDTEWAAARRVLGDELLGALTGTTLVSMRRYASGTRVTPDDVAARLHFVVLVNADLAGSYNDLGIRRWWQRPRGQLDRVSPLQALTDGWDPDTSEAAATVRTLAAALVGAGAAT